MSSLHLIAACLITIAATGLPASYAQSIGDIRLSSSCSGNLEVYVNGLTYGKRWYQVCDRGMNDTEARVICRQLGCPTTYATATQASFGYAFIVYYVRQGYRCLGSEPSLSSCRRVSGQCSSSSIDGGDNDHVAIRCRSSTPSPPPPPTRSPVDGCLGGTQCIGFSSYCSGGGRYSATCVSGSCRCVGQPNRDYCTCLPKIGSCHIQEGLSTAVGTPTYRRESQTTYSCVATDNCMYDVHVVSMYESMSSFSHTAGTATVILRVSGPNQGAKPLVLALVSYEPVRWSLSVPSGVTIHRVLLASYYLETSSVSGVSSQIVERIPYQTLPYGRGDDSGGGNTEKLLMYVTDRFGPVASFSGTYRASRWELVVQRTPVESNCVLSTLNESSLGAELGDVRLSGGCSGELQVYSNPLNSEGWYSVCATGSRFDNSESRVVCRQLGCPVNGASSTTSTSISSLPSLTSQFNCYGGESALSQCQETTDQCSSTNIITVQCADSLPYSPSPPRPVPPIPENEISSAQAQAQAQAGGIAVGVIASVGFIIALFIGVVCYKNGVCKKRNPRPSQMRNNRQTPVTTYQLASVGSSAAMNRNNVYATTYMTTTPLNGTQYLYQQPQHPYQSQLHSATTTLDQSSHLEANTHAGEAPPAYHTSMHYETMTLEDYKSLKLSEGSAVNSAKSDSDNTDAPPTYSEIVGGQDENSVKQE